MRRSILPFSLLVTAGLAFTACGSDTVSEKIAEKAIEAGSNGDVDIDLDSDGDGGIKIDTEDGSYTADENGNVVIESQDGTFKSGVTDEFPDGFPDLPLPELTILNATEASDGNGVSYVITAQSSDDAGDLLADFVAAMEAEGYTTTGKNESTSDGQFFGGATFVDGGDFDVTFTSIGDGSDVTTVGVSVIPAQ